MDSNSLLEGLIAARNGNADRQLDNYARITGGIGPDYDYGKAGTVDGRGHVGDTGKLPNHPTFSQESAYSNGLAQGGRWIADAEGNYIGFEPSVQMAKDQGRMKSLANYIREVEPGVKLIMPAPYKGGSDGMSI